MDGNQLVFERFHREVNFSKSPELVKLDTAILKKFENYVQKPIEQVTKDDVLNYFHSLTLAPYSIELHKSQIKKFFKWLYHFDETGKVPEQVSWIKVNRKKVYKYKTKADILTKAEINTLIAACKTPVERAMVSVLYDSAARIDEFIKLKISDVVKEGDEYSICVTGKTGQRNIPLNYSMKYMLEYLESHPQRNNRNAPLWLNRKNTQYSENGIYTIMKSIVKRSGIQKHVHNHLFRHSRLTELAHEGMNESQMRVFAGWKNDSTMPAIYLHLSNDDVKDALRKIEPKVNYVEQNTVEEQVMQRLEQEKQKIHDEVLQQLLETLKNPQSHVIQDYLFAQSEQQ